MNFVLKLSALPAAQQALWPQLKQVPRQFVLYGGTALALRLGHRPSVDFDFFADAPISPNELLRSLPVLKDATIRQLAPNTLTVTTSGAEPVKLSFFGLTLRRVRDPEWTADGVVRVASLLDVAACKLAVIQQRAESRDYLDIYALLQHGLALPEALAAAQAVYGAQFNPMISLKALTSFVDGDLKTLPQNLQSALRQAAAAVQEIPDMQPLPGGLASDSE